MILRTLVLALCLGCAPAASALDSTRDSSFGTGGPRLLTYPVASDEADQGLAILHDGLGRRIVIVARRNPFSLAPERPLQLILFPFLADGSVDTGFGSGSGPVRAELDRSECRGTLLDRFNRILVVGTTLIGSPQSALLQVVA